MRQGIYYFLKKYQETGSIRRKEGAGRKTKINSAVKRIIEDKMQEDDESTVKELQKLLKENKIGLGKTSVDMTLDGPTEAVPTARDHNKIKLSQWAKENLGDSFFNCIYSDESTVQLETHRRFCCTKTGYKPRCKPRPKHPIKVHVWAAISKRGRSGICIFEGCMNARGYVNILEKTLLPMIQELYPDGHRFVQVNDPKHTSALAKQFFEDRNINCWPTPAESPDANPIENRWHELKKYLRCIVKPTTKEALISGITEFWSTVDIQKCTRYINHLNKVIPKIIECNGGPTGY